MPETQNASIAVAIPARNGFPEIRDCIEGLLRQTLKPSRIYVMDSASTDGTLEYLRTIPEVTVIPVDPAAFNHGETRNLGWQHATEDYVFYTVQDAKPVNEFLLENLLKGFTDEGIMAVCGQQVVPHDRDKNPVEWFRPVSEPKALLYHFDSPAAFESLSPEQKKNICAWDDVAALYRRTALEQVPFRKVVFGEDMQWAKDALLHGFSIAYQPSARVYHYHLENPDFSFKRAFTTMYFRYRNFGYIPPAPSLSFRQRLSILKTLVRSLGFDPAGWLRWYRYNLDVFDAISRAHRTFSESLLKGEAALDEAHSTYCGKPPLVKKSHESRATAG
jgi:rhamnosyltransferase